VFVDDPGNDNFVGYEDDDSVKVLDTLNDALEVLYVLINDGKYILQIVEPFIDSIFEDGVINEINKDFRNMDFRRKFRVARGQRKEEERLSCYH